MSHPARFLPALALALLPLPACSKSPSGPTGTDPVLLSRIDDLERKLADLSGASEEARGDEEVAGLRARSQAERLRNVEDDLAEMKRHLAAAPAGQGTAPSADVPPVTPPAGSPVPGATPSGSAPLAPDAPVPEEQVAWFRRVQEEVRRRDQEQQRAERFKRELARAKVTLTPEQEAAVLKIEGAYMQRVRDLYRNGLGDTPADRESLNAQRQALWGQFETEVRGAIPASEADRLITSLQDRNRGLYGGPLRPGRGMDEGNR